MAKLDDLLDSMIADSAVEASETRTATDDLIDDIIAETKKETGFTRWAQYSAASSALGLAQIAEDLGLPVDFDEDEALLYRDLAELASEDNPLIGLAGQLAGSTLDLAGGSLAGAGIRTLGRLTNRLGAQGWNNLFTQGLAGGAVGGFLEPILTEEDSLALNVGLGTAFGGVLGAGAMGISRLLRGQEPTPTPEAGQLALPAPTQPVGLLPSPEIATPRIPFQPDATGKPPTAGGVIPMGQQATGLPTARVAPEGTTVIPGQPIPQPLGLPRPVEFSPEASQNALAKVRQDLLNITDTDIDLPKLRRAQVKVRQANGRIEAWKNQKPSKALDAKIKAEEAKIKKDKELIKEYETVKQAKAELVRLDRGAISPLILDRVKNVAEKEARDTAVPPTRPVTEATPPPNVRTRETAGRPVTPDQSTVGAQQVDPTRAMIDPEEIERIPRASTQAATAQGPVYGQGGRVFTEAETRRRKMYQNAEDVGRQYFFEPADLLGRGYSFENVEQAAQILQRDIDEAITEGNFKDAGDWLIKTFEASRTKTLTPVEQLVATRVLAIASNNLNQLMSTFRKLANTNQLNSAEGVRMADDLQVTKELMNTMRTLERIDEASRRNISNALRNYKLANKYQQKHQKELMENKIITDLFFGVTCG